MKSQLIVASRADPKLLSQIDSLDIFGDIHAFRIDLPVDLLLLSHPRLCLTAKSVSICPLDERSMSTLFKYLSLNLIAMNVILIYHEMALSYYACSLPPASYRALST
jgi:hypothetical protein